MSCYIPGRSLNPLDNHRPETKAFGSRDSELSENKKFHFTRSETNQFEAIFKFCILSQTRHWHSSCPSMPDLISFSDEADGHVIDPVHIYVKLPFGIVRTKYLQIDMNVNWMILAAKTWNQIFLQTGIPVGNQLLFWASNCLEDLLTIQEYSIATAQSYFVDLLIGLNVGVS